MFKHLNNFLNPAEPIGEVRALVPSQVRSAGSGSGRPAPRFAPGTCEGGGHVGAAGPGGGVLQPVPAARPRGGDAGAAGPDDLPAGER